MDDFGTGYSSLAYLQRLPIDVLKIDQQFRTGMIARPRRGGDRARDLSLAEALGKETTAEGIETAELARRWRHSVALRARAILFARPIEADAALDYWRRVAGIQRLLRR